MKKLIALLLAAVLVFALCACGSSAAPATTTEAAATEATAEEAAPAEEAAAEEAAAEEAAPAEESTGATETVKIICPYGAGGVADNIARKFAEVANTVQTKYNFICENMTGGDGFVANEFFASEDPMTHDLLVFGYGACYRNALGLAYGTEEVNWDRSATLPLGTVDDRIWVMYALPGTTLEDVITKATTEGIKMSGGNPLSDPHLILGSIMAQIGGSVQVVPYDGGAEQKKGLTDGEVDVFIGATLAGKDEVEAGTLIPLLTFSETKFTGFIGPDGEVVDVPTIAGEDKAAELPADMDFSGSILPGGGSLASHVGGDEAFQADMIEVIKEVWASPDFYDWQVNYGLNPLQLYAPELTDYYEEACQKSLTIYEIMANA